MSDEAKPSAWAVIGDDYEYATLLAEHAGAVAAEEGGMVVPLYRSPTLTDAEREAVWAVAEAYAENDDDPECHQIARVMHGLWQRTR